MTKRKVCINIAHAAALDQLADERRCSPDELIEILLRDELAKLSAGWRDELPVERSVTMQRRMWRRLGDLAIADPTRPNRCQLLTDLLMRLPEFADFVKASNGAPASTAAEKHLRRQNTKGEKLAERIDRTLRQPTNTPAQPRAG